MESPPCQTSPFKSWGVFELRAGGDEAVVPLVVGMGEDFMKSSVIQQGDDFFRLVMADFEGQEATWGKMFGKLVRQTLDESQAVIPTI